MNALQLSKRQARLGTALLALMLWSPRALHAVIFASTDDPTHNTNDPTGALAASGWQYLGVWYGFVGTCVSPRHFVTAKHAGGTVGGAFQFQGISYPTIGVTNNGTDLNVWEISGSLPVYAPLYEGESPVGQSVVIFGRGTRRGADVVVNGQVKGWLWGAADGRLRWGENVVAGKFGSLLKFDFDRAAGPNEAQLSSGDSGGGIFVNDQGTWKLAAINYAIEGPWKLSSTGAVFNAAIVDKGGLFRGTTQHAETEADQPAAFYATPIAPNYGWLAGVLALPKPEPPAGLQLLVSDSRGPAVGPGGVENPVSLFGNEKGPAIRRPLGFELKTAVRTGP